MNQVVLLDTIRSFFSTDAARSEDSVTPAPPGTYEIKPLTSKHIKELIRLNLRCFQQGDNYTRHAFDYLFNDPNTLSYRVVDGGGELVGFVFVMVNENGAAHLTTIGIAPEHRRRGLAKRLLKHVEAALIKREISTLVLEVRVSNTHAQDLYRRCGYYVVQRVNRYYLNGEDCYLMVKSLVSEAVLA